jgi:regulator of replication initiation timing
MSDTDAQLGGMLLDFVNYIDKVEKLRERNRHQVAVGRKKRKRNMEELVAENKALVAENQHLKEVLIVLGVNVENSH